MNSYYVTLNGLWSFDFSIEATSKEEAIQEAMELMEKESGSIDLEHVDQHVEEESDSGMAHGPGPSDMKISGDFFNDIRIAVGEREDLEALSNVGAPDKINNGHPLE
jgi:hypothetical protein